MSTPAAEPDAARAPSMWLLLGHKAGDNSQVQALAAALGWPFEIRRLSYRPYELLTNRLLRVTLAGVRRERSDALAPPWPDLVITAGRRNEPVARWIRKQSAGRTRIVHVGRPWAAIRHFDLIVTTPQYHVPPGPAVLRIDLPLHRLGPEQLALARAQWAARFEDLPRPRIAVLVGGDSGKYVFLSATLERLARAAQQLAAERDGSLLVTTSARTPRDALDIFRATFTVPTFSYGWSPGAGDNPYLGILAVADEIIVTGESMSMLAEACATARPVHIFDPGPDHPEQGAAPGTSREPPWWLRLSSYRWKPLSYRLGQLLGPPRLRRDVGAIQRHLVATGRAVWLGDPPPATPPVEPSRDLDHATARVRALFDR